MKDSPTPRHVVIYGIDPGSSDSWAVYRALMSREQNRVTQVTRCVHPIQLLEALIQEIVSGTADYASTPKDIPVILSLDAPLNMPTRFEVPGPDLPNAHWPFNVNPFAVRPCEKALSSKPQIVNANLQHFDLAQTIGLICSWEGDFAGRQNTKFSSIHPGVSVLGYQGAPHGPVVRLFRDRLAKALHEISVQTVYSPWSASDPATGFVYVLESHPAVSMAVSASQGQLQGIDVIPTYKGDNDPETLVNFQNLRASVLHMAAAYLDVDELPLEDDNDLDAFVGFLNVVDLLRGAGDWIGTVARGFFMSPRIHNVPDNRLMSEIWRDAGALYEQV